MPENVTVNLAPFQDVFVNSEEEAVAIIAGKGSGKTFSGALFVLKQIVEQPGSQGLVMLNTLQQTRDIYVQEIETRLKELRWPYHFNQQTMVLKVFNCIIHLRSAEITAIEKIESVAYMWGWADEASFYDSKALETFVSRIRKGKALKRITSMPDEPDAFMYPFLEKYPFRMYEMGLQDNPDKEFRDRYEKMLRATYSGAQLDRFLSGKRVSLSGLGMFAVEGHMRQSMSIDPEIDLHLSWDFNVEYRAVSAWQIIGHQPNGMEMWGCVHSWQMKGSTVYEDALALSGELHYCRKTVYLHGDASGQNRTASTTDSMWKTVKEVFISAFGIDRVRFLVPSSNPPVKDTIQCANWAFRSGIVRFAEHERNLYQSLAACKADKYGEIDKSNDYKPSGAKTHEADTARYFLWHAYKTHYPGKRSDFWII